MELYKFNIKDLTEDEYEHYRSLMSEERRKRLDGLRFEEDRKRSLCGYMLAVKALSHLTGTAENDIVIADDKNGKPFAENIGLQFSVSHSGELAVCAVGENRIGVDIEKVREVNMQSAKRFANEEELIYIFGRLPEKEDFKSKNGETLKHFFEIWTKKEAIGKTKGVGIGYDMKNADTSETLTYENNGYVITVCEEK
ncbi:MAG: 4'-phosphopantetheinyl transferase superfamily protein [Oscillospiraceae bacterium]|nr:4'-phosphopantetheinyl transferase superfamily protein [Oscillospiraceae bacterium]